jgi:NADH-quinone oxidoreductase subunit G
MEGVAQSFNGVVKPAGDARPAWKVLRVLGNQFGFEGFAQESIEAVRESIAPDLQVFVTSHLNNLIGGVDVKVPSPGDGIERVGDVPIYATDSLVRRAVSLQKTADAKRSHVVALAKDVAATLGAKDGDAVRVSQEGASISMTACIDAGLAAGCARVPAGIDATAALGAMAGRVVIEKAAIAQAAE